MCFEENYSIFMERFPELGLQIPPLGKTLTPKNLPKIPLPNVKQLYIYELGMGEGYEEYQDWLNKDPSHRLIFLEEDLSAISSFLHLKSAKPILQNTQVDILILTQLDAYLEKNPVVTVEAIAPLDLKQKILQKGAFAHASFLDRLHGYHLFENFIQNLKHLPTSFYANALLGKFENVPAIVCGAGPSLQDAIPILKTLENKALLIAGGSTIKALTASGIKPHFAMAIDPNPEEYHRLKNSLSSVVPFLYSTRLYPKVFVGANGPFGYMRSGTGGILEIWMEEELGLLDPLIGQELSMDAISVTCMCLAFAKHLGCSPILLSGVDLAYTDNKRYAPGVLDQEAKELSISTVDRIINTQDRNGAPIATAVRFQMESLAISDFAASCPKTCFLNTTSGGIGFEKIPYVPLQEALKPFSDIPNLRKKIHEAISSSPMPKNTEEIINKKMKELLPSLKRIISHLEICSGVKNGSTALAELELQEEFAYPYLFYDIDQLLPKKDKWKHFLTLARKYQSAAASYS